MTNPLLDRLVEETTPRTLVGAMGAIVAMTLLAGHLYVVKPSLASLRQLEGGDAQGAVARLTAEADTAERAIGTTRGALAALSEELYGGTSQLPPERVESYIVDRLDQISARHAVELVSVKPGEAKQVLMFDELLYEVEVKGQFSSLVAWLWELEDELRPLVVNGFDMHPTARGAWVGMKLRLASYRPTEEVS